MTRKIAILFCAQLAAAAVALAERPVERPPAGMGKYIVVLRYPEPRAPSEGAANPPQKIELPDVAKLGGRVLQTAEKKLLIFLPRQAVGHLRADRNVAYVQRVWTGEAFDDWEDADLPDTSGRVAAEAVELPPTWTTGEYAYDGSGNIASIGTDNAFRYDAFGRLVTADVKGVAETYTYDAFGNRTASTINGQQVVVPVDPLSNRLANHAYDAAGNVISGRGFTSYQYDSAGMPSKITTRDGQQKRIIYTPDDERIGVYMNQTLSRWTIRDFGGQVLREFEAHHQSSHPVDAMWLWVEDYVYAGGAAVGAEREPHHGGRLHFHRDHLGSTRMMTTESGRKLAIHDYAPFGRELTLPTQEMTETGRKPESMKFTGHERDYHSWSTITGDDDDYLDYMHARYYNAVWGRFLSVDPAMTAGTMTHPQMWNRYSYVMNRPLNFTDPTGRYPCKITLTGSDAKTAGVKSGTQLDGECVERKAPPRSLFSFNFPYLSWAEERRAQKAREGQPNKSTFTPSQCRSLFTIVQREAREGTQRAAARSSNTWGDRTIGQFNVDFNTRGNPTLSNGAMIDVDWFTDINSYTGNMQSAAPAAYVFGKSFWHAVGGTQGWPFQDPGEVTAVSYASRGASYNEIYNQACP